MEKEPNLSLEEQVSLLEKEINNMKLETKYKELLAEKEKLQQIEANNNNDDKDKNEPVKVDPDKKPEEIENAPKKEPIKPLPANNKLSDDISLEEAMDTLF